jgi:membrane protease YdiL (CAAX protease family)
MEAMHLKIRIFALSVSAVLVVELIVRMSNLTSSLLALGLARLIQGALIVWIVGGAGTGMVPIGLDRAGWFHGFRRGILWSAAFGAVALCAFVILSLAGMNVLSVLRTPLPSKVHTMVLFFIVGGVVAPFVEELFFRGLLYGFFRRWGLIFALILSTVFFTIAHPLRSLPLTQIVGGLLFALAYEMERNLLVPITIHMLGNLAIFTLSALF